MEPCPIGDDYTGWWPLTWSLPSLEVGVSQTEVVGGTKVKGGTGGQQAGPLREEGRREQSKERMGAGRVVEVERLGPRHGRLPALGSPEPPDPIGADKSC